VSNDFIQYQLVYDQLSASDGPIEFIINNRFEPGFVVLYYYLSSVLSGSDTFLLVASIILSTKYILFIRYLNHPIVAWFIYIIIFLPTLEASQLRSAISTTIVIYILFHPVYREKFILKSILAAMFHYVGLIIYLLKFTKKPFFGILLIILAAIFFDNILLLMSNNVFKVNQFISASDNGEYANIFNSITVIQFLISLCCIFNWKHFNEAQKRGAFLIIIGLLIYSMLNDNPGVAHRVREISLLGIFPLLFSSKIRINYSSLLLFSCIMSMCVYYLVFTVLEIIQVS